MFETWRFKIDALSQLRGHRLVPALIILFYMAIRNVMVLQYAAFTPDSEALLGYSAEFFRYWDFSFPSLGGMFPAVGNRAGILVCMGILVSLITAAIQIALYRYFLAFSTSSAATGFPVFLDGLVFWGKSILGSVYLALRMIAWSLLLIPLFGLFAALESVLGWRIIMAALFPAGIGLWGFLYFYKYLSYSQMFFVLAEYPQVGVRKALKTSALITQGCRGHLFLLLLSFLGWEILCLFTAGIGFLFLHPYLFTTQANAYKFLKTRAFKAGILVPRAAPPPPEEPIRIEEA
ncbi:MAG: DUF975 family protein [Spirochaetaceae bacterium]|jgi:uncharacterized membrane protein|nr:DUF975 family protein [Spirochaetaceae bacterium]